MFRKSKTSKSPVRRRLEWALTIVALSFGSVIVAPQLLAFPHKAVVGDTTIFSETPIPSEIGIVLAKSDALLRQSAIYSDSYGKRIFLTDGGWRWRLLSLRSSGAFAISRVWSGTIVINKSSVKENWVRGETDIVRQRSLSSIISHERTHGLIVAKLGALASLLAPAWKVEGYCDHVAQETSLNAVDVARYRQTGIDHPAIVYFEGKQKVAAALAKNGNSVDQLFAQ